MNILGIFRTIGRVIKRALVFAEQRGLTDDLVAHALRLVAGAQASATLTDNAARREWVVAQLQAYTRAPESVVRLAVELAVAGYKKQVAG